MAKFNKNPNDGKTINLAGGDSYSRVSFHKEVSSIILNSMVSGGGSFYETEADRLTKIKNFIIDNPSEGLFLAKTMVYARTIGNLRSVSHYMAVILAESVKGSSYLRKAILKTILRPDDATEMVALWNERNDGKMVPNVLRRAIKDALEVKFDSYQLKKYFGTNNVVKVSDLIKLTHPTPSSEEKEVMFKQALSGTLPNINTAQTVNSGSASDKKKLYKGMLRSGTLGYMAMLKNLHTLATLGFNEDGKSMNSIYDLLVKKTAILGSKILPYRIYQAYSSIYNSSKVNVFVKKKLLSKLEEAFVISAGAIDIVSHGEKVAVLLDDSGSMSTSSGNSGLSAYEMGKVLSAGIFSKLNPDDTVGYLWSSGIRDMNISSNHALSFVETDKATGYGTDLSQAIDKLMEREVSVDVMIILTDMQIRQFSRLNASVEAYKAELNKPDLKIVFWNLQGYGGGTPLKLNKKVLELAGYSDSLLKLLPKVLENEDALVDDINAISI